LGVYALVCSEYIQVGASSCRTDADENNFTMKNINELIEVNLKLLYEVNNNSLFFDDFVDCDGNELYATFRVDHFASEMKNRSLITIKDSLCIITEFGFNIVNNGGWLKHLIEIEKVEKISLEQKNIKDQLELDLAKSNLEANKLNRDIAERNTKNEKKNQITTWVNIIIGILNFSALIWQIIKPAK
jgi:hypothetical protein